MNLYYCEFCNENKQIPIETSKAICDSCGHFLRKVNIPQPEIEQKKLARTIHCPNCDEKVYSVSFDALYYDFKKKHEFERYKILIYSPLIFLFATVINIILTVFFSNLVTFILTVTFSFLTFGTLLIATIFNNKKNKIIRTYHTKLINSGYGYFCSKCLQGIRLRTIPSNSIEYRDRIRRQKERAALGLFVKDDPLTKFSPITPNIDISEFSYSGQLGLSKEKWALRLYKGNKIIDTHIFKDQDINEWGFPDQNLIIARILYKIPDTNPYHLEKVVQDLIRQALQTKERKEIVEDKLDSIKNAVENIEHLMKENAVNKLRIERQYLPEIFSADLIGISRDGLPTLKRFVQKEFELLGITIKLYPFVITFFKKK